MSTIKKEIPSIWALKGLCAIFVVLIHIPFHEDKYILPIINISVPTFFIISGYFLYNERISRAKEKIKAWVKKIALLIILLNLFYYICLAGVGNVKGFKDVLISILTGDRICGHLWYLSALLWALIIFYTLLRKTDKYVRCLPVLMLFSIFLGRYSFLYAEEPGIQALRANFLFPALPCLSVGYLIRKYEQNILSIRCRCIAPLFFVFLALIYLECYTLVNLNLNNNTSYLLMTLPMATIVMVVAVRHKDVQFPILTGIGKKHSDKIYYFHIAVNAILTRFVFVHVTLLKEYAAFIVIIVSIIVSCCINYSVQNIRS